MKIESYLKQCQQRVKKALIHFLPSVKKNPRELHKAMQYSSLNGGKRIRSSLIYTIGDAFGADKKVLDCLCAAMEMIHAFSLIHDDLPALDNDDLRRGKPACHKAFGEATAILAGDALHVLAFKTVSHLSPKYLKPTVLVEIIKILSKCTLGMIQGETLDTLMEGKKVSLNQLAYTYKLKTGRLLTASILLGALAGNCQNKTKLKHLKMFGDYIGLAFQIHDDIIGVESTSEITGKSSGSDELRNKPTYPSVLGLEKAKKIEKAIFDKAIQYLKKANIAEEKLSAIAHYIINRVY